MVCDVWCVVDMGYLLRNGALDNVIHRAVHRDLGGGGG